MEGVIQLSVDYPGNSLSQCLNDPQALCAVEMTGLSVLVCFAASFVW